MMSKLSRTTPGMMVAALTLSTLGFITNTQANDETGPRKELNKIPWILGTWEATGPARPRSNLTPFAALDGKESTSRITNSDRGTHFEGKTEWIVDGEVVLEHLNIYYPRRVTPESPWELGLLAAYSSMSYQEGYVKKAEEGRLESVYRSSDGVMEWVFVFERIGPDEIDLVGSGAEAMITRRIKASD